MALIERIRPGARLLRASRAGRVAVRLALALAVTLPWLSRGTVDAKLALGDYEIIGEALHAMDMDEWPRAKRLMESIDDPLPWKLFNWRVLIEDRDKADFNELARFILENPTWPEIDKLRSLAEGRLTDSADQALTLQLFEQFAPLTTRGRIRFGEALFAADRPQEAAQQIKAAWKGGDFSAREEKSFLRRHRNHLSSYDNEIRLKNLLWDRSSSSAKRMLPKVSDDLQKLAKARLALQQQAPGVDQAIARVPESLSKDAGLAYDRIRWRRLKGKHQDAVDLLLEPPKELGRPERWWYERSYQIRRAVDRRDFDTAYQLASHHGQTRGGDYAEAEWLAGWLALRFNKRPKTAFRHFVRLYDRVIPPVRQARAAYWAGRAASAQRDEAGATAWYRRAASHHLTYYGQLAAGELDEQTLIRKPSAPTNAERVAFEAKEVTRVAHMLIAARAADHLDPFLHALSNQAEGAGEIGMVAELAVAGGRPSLLARVGRRAAFEGKVYDPAAFPVPRIEGLLKPVADGVQPSLLLGLARQESMFESAAASKAGARGLLQLLPSTARLVAQSVGETYDLDRLVGDPNYNALLGGHYLSWMLERYDGETALALAAYNAGPLRVKRWIEQHGDPRSGNPHDLVDWIELIPFPETRNYVQRVLEAYRAYSIRLASIDVALIDFPGSTGLSPPPLPLPRPEDELEASDGGGGQATTIVLSHKPRFRPRTDETLRPAIANSFDDRDNRYVAADDR